MKLASAAFAAVFFVTLATAACSSDGTTASGDGGGPPPIKASDYNQHCSVASDCVVVDEGDVCGCGSCGNAAINKSDQTKFEADVTARVKQCPNGRAIACPAGACILSLTMCTTGTCGVCHAPGCDMPDAGGDAGGDAAGD